MNEDKKKMDDESTLQAIATKQAMRIAYLESLLARLIDEDRDGQGQSDGNFSAELFQEIRAAVTARATDQK